MERRVAELNSEIDKLQTLKRELEVQLKEAVASQHEAMTRAVRLADRNQELETALRGVDNMALDVEQKQTREQLRIAQEHLDSALNQLAEREGHMQNLQKHNLELQAEMHACKTVKGQLEKVLDSALDEKKKLHNNVNQLKVHEHDLMLEIERLANRPRAEERAKSSKQSRVASPSRSPKQMRSTSPSRSPKLKGTMSRSQSPKQKRHMRASPPQFPKQKRYIAVSPAKHEKPHVSIASRICGRSRYEKSKVSSERFKKPQVDHQHSGRSLSRSPSRDKKAVPHSPVRYGKPPVSPQHSGRSLSRSPSRDKRSVPHSPARYGKPSVSPQHSGRSLSRSPSRDKRSVLHSPARYGKPTVSHPQREKYSLFPSPRKASPSKYGKPSPPPSRHVQIVPSSKLISAVSSSKLSSHPSRVVPFFEEAETQKVRKKQSTEKLKFGKGKIPQTKSNVNIATVKYDVKVPKPQPGGSSGGVIELRRKLNEKEQELIEIQQVNRSLLNERDNLQCRLESVLAKDPAGMGSLQTVVRRVQGERDQAIADIRRIEEELKATRGRLKVATEAHLSDRNHREDEVRRLEESCRSLEIERRELLTEQGKLRAKANNLEDQFESQQSYVKDLESELSQKRTLYNQLQTLQNETDRALANSQAKVNQLSTQLDHALDRVRQLEKDRSHLEQSLKKANDDLQKSKLNLSKFDETKDTLLSHVDKKTEKIAMLEEEMEAREERIAALQQNIEDLKKKLKIRITIDDNLKKEQDDRKHQREVDRLRHELNVAVQQKEAVVWENRKLQDDLAATTSDCRTTRRELESVQNQVEDLKRQLQVYVTEVRRAEDLLSGRENERETILQEFANLTHEAEALGKQNQSLETASLEIKQELRQANHQIADLETELETKRTLINGYERQISELTQFVASLESQLQQQIDNGRRLQTELSAAQNLCSQVDEQKEKLMKDISEVEHKKMERDADNSHLKNELALIKDLLENEKAKVHSFEMLLSEARNKAMLDKRTNDELSSTVERLQTKVRSLESRLEQETAEVSRCQGVITEYSREIEDLRRQITNERFERARAAVGSISARSSPEDASNLRLDLPRATPETESSSRYKTSGNEMKRYKSDVHGTQVDNISRSHSGASRSINVHVDNISTRSCDGRSEYDSSQQTDGRDRSCVCQEDKSTSGHSPCRCKHEDEYAKRCSKDFVKYSVTASVIPSRHSTDQSQVSRALSPNSETSSRRISATENQSHLSLKIRPIHYVTSEDSAEKTRQHIFINFDQPQLNKEPKVFSIGRTCLGNQISEYCDKINQFSSLPDGFNRTDFKLGRQRSRRSSLSEPASRSLAIRKTSGQSRSPNSSKSNKRHYHVDVRTTSNVMSLPEVPPAENSPYIAKFSIKDDSRSKATSKICASICSCFDGKECSPVKSVGHLKWQKCSSSSSVRVSVHEESPDSKSPG